jgi:putative exosortase-associated protein (TIGR04073 family)
MKTRCWLFKAAFCVAALGGMFYLATPAQAYHQNPMRKFGRGLGNVMGGWTEVPFQVHKVDVEEGPIAAYTYGVAKGTTYFVGRTVTGFWEMLTFPLPNGGGRGYDPIFRPEFPLHDFNDSIFFFLGDD